MRSVGLEEYTRRGACRSRPRITGARCARSSAVRDDQGLTGQPRCRDAAGLGCTAVDLPHCHSSYGRMKEKQRHGSEALWHPVTRI